MDLVVVPILLTGHQLLQLSCEVVSCAAVDILVSVNTILSRSSNFFFLSVIIEAVPAVPCAVTDLASDLALDQVIVGLVAAGRATTWTSTLVVVVEGATTVVELCSPLPPELE